MRTFCAILAGILAALFAVTGAYAQVDRPGLSGGAVVGSSPGYGTEQRRPSSRFGSSQTPMRHLGSDGKACVYVLGQARPQAINPNLYEHVLIVNNGCGLPVKLRVCYYGTESCNDVSIAAFTRRQEIFGIMPNAKDFRFEYREYFN